MVADPIDRNGHHHAHSPPRHRPPPPSCRSPRWFLTTPVSSTPATPMPRPTRTLPPTSAAARAHRARHCPARPARPRRQRGLAAEPASEGRAEEGPGRHHQHRAGLHQPGGARADAEVGADGLQQRGVGRERRTEVDGEREHAEQHDGRPTDRGTAPAPGRHGGLMPTTFARRGTSAYAAARCSPRDRIGARALAGGRAPDRRELGLDHRNRLRRTRRRCTARWPRRPDPVRPQAASRSTAAAMRSSVAVTATRTCRSPAGP